MKDDFTWEVRIGIALILLSPVVFGVIFYFILGRMGDQVSAIQSRRTEIENYIHSVEILAKLKADAAQIDVYQAGLDALLPGKDDLINFSSWLTTFAKGYGVTVNFGFQGNVAEAGPGELGSAGFQLDANGTLPNLQKFFDDLETASPRFLVNIDSLDLASANQDYRASTHGRVFFKQQ